jgi:O-antigen ligase
MSEDSQITVSQSDGVQPRMGRKMGYIYARPAWLMNSLIFFLIFSYYSNVFAYLALIKFLPFPLYYTSFVPLIIIFMVIFYKRITILKIHPLIIISLIIISIELILYLFHINNDDGENLLFIEIYLLLFLLSVLLMISNVPGAVQSARLAVLSVAIMTVMLGFYEFFHPFVFLPLEFSNPGRVSVFFINPNRCGIALVLALVFCIEIIPSKLRSIFVLLILTGIIITFSRSSILAGILVIFLLLYFNIVNRKQFFIYSSIFLIIIIILVPIIINNVLSTSGMNINNIIERLDWFYSIGQVHDFSSQERIKVVKRGLESINYNFFEGIGISGITKWDTFPHNMYIYFAVQYGVIGFFMYPLFLLSAVSVGFSSNKWMFVTYVVVMLFFGFFSHNLMQEHYVLVSYALVAALGLKGAPTRELTLLPSKTPGST